MLFIVKIYLACWLFTRMDIIQELVNKAFGWFYSKYEPNRLTDGIHIVLGCQMCLTFWVTGILICNFWLAIVASIVAEIHKKYTE